MESVLSKAIKARIICYDCGKPLEEKHEHIWWRDSRGVPLYVFVDLCNKCAMLEKMNERT